MQPTDGKRFRDLIRGMGRMYGQEQDAVVLDAYWLALRDWSFEDFEAAAGQLMRTSKFMPRPADFNDLRKAARPTVGEAWDKARRACGSAIICGQITNNGTSGDPLIDRAVRAIGGYGAIAMCDTEKLHFLERRFCEHFESMRDADDVREALPQIAGPDRPRLAHSAIQMLTKKISA
jgi:hypothetical protein